MLTFGKNDLSERADASGALDLAVGSAWAMLADLARRPDAFQAIVNQAFGSAGTDAATFRAASAALQMALAQGSDPGISFDLLTDAQMQGGRGAYAGRGPDGKAHVYVNADWLATATTAAAAKVLVEEIGHAIDQRLNGALDSRGDEGELFSDLVTGTRLTADQLAAILAEDDHGTLQIDGSAVAVEFSIDAGAVTGAADSKLNASELASGLQITGVSKLSGTGTSFLVAIFTSATATAPIYWQKSAASVLTSDTTLVNLTISTANLNGYQGPIYIRIYQGTSSGAGQSAAITGSTVAYPASSSFSVNSALNGTALTTSNATTATGQWTLGLYTIDTTAPAAVSAPDLATASDTGPSSTDNITSKTTPTFAGTGAESGVTVTLYDTGGVTVLGTAVADGSGNWSITASTLAAGAHTVTAKQTDAAGNVSAASSSLVVTVDTSVAAPGAPDLATASDTGTSSTDNLTNKTTPTITGTGAESGATVTLYDTGGVTVLGTATADGTGAWSIVTATLAAGAHTLTAKQTDLAGNTSAASASLVVTIDTTAPGAPGVPDLATASDTGTSSTDNITSKTTPTITGTGADAGATVTLYDTGGVTVLGTATADGTGAWSIVTATLAAGAHTLTAKQTDAAGNASAASAALTVTIDTAAAVPSAPDLAAASDTGTSNTDNITTATTPTFTGSGADAGATVTLYDTDGTTVLGTTTADGTGAWSITSSKLAGGVHTVAATQTDLAGNVSALSATLAVTIDVRPSAPTMDSASDTGSSNTDGITSDSTPTFTGSGATAGSTVTLYDTDGITVLGTATANGSGNWSITSTSMTNGAHTLTTKAGTGQASVGLVVTIDTLALPPDAPDLAASFDSGASAFDNVTAKTTVTVTGGAAEARSTVTLYDTDGTTSLGSTTADDAGTWSIATSTLSAGTHTLTVTQVDLAGNISAPGDGLDVTVDTTAPTAPSTPDLATASDTGLSGTDNITSKTTPILTGTGAEAGGVVTLYDTDGTTALGSTTADASGVWSIVSATLTGGTHTLAAKQTDRAGNVSAASTALSVTIDTAPAAAPGTPDLAAASDTGISNADNLTSKTTPTITGAGAESGATVTLYDSNGSTVLGTATADVSGAWSVVTSTLAAGQHLLTARQTDKAGNVSTASAGLVITIDGAAVAPSLPDLIATSDSGISNTDNLTSLAAPVLTVTGAEAGATVTLYDTNGITVLGSAVADAGGTWMIVSSALAAGVHTLTAKQTDKAGNVSAASAGLVVTIDTTAAAAPSAPDLAAASDTGVSNTDNLTSLQTPTFTGTGAETGATVTLYDTNRLTVLGSTVADGLGAWSITSVTLANGLHTLTAKQTDKAGNVSAASAALSVTIDSVVSAPSAPDLAVTSDSGLSNVDNLTNRTNPTLSGIGGEVGATVTLYDTNGTTALGTATADGAGAWQISSATLAAGAHMLTAKQVDKAGNVSTASIALEVTIDATTAAAPAAPALVLTSDTGASNSDNLTNKVNPTLGGSGADAGVTVTLYDTDGVTPLGSSAADATGAWIVTTATLTPGSHTLTARQMDRAGNVSLASDSVTIVVDTTVVAPDAPDLAAASDSGVSSLDNVTNKTAPTFSGAGADAGATVTLYDTNGTTVLGSAKADETGAWSIVTTTMTGGVHAVTAKQTDKAGNVSVASAGLLVTIDATLPLAPTGLDLVVASDTGASGIDNITGDTTPTISGIGAEAGATVTLFDTDGTTILGTTKASAAGAWMITAGGLSAGAHTLTARQTDKAGNTGPASGGLVVTVTAPVTMAAPVLPAASDSGTSASDLLTNVTTPVVSGGGATAGATVTLYDTNGANALGSAVADSAGNWVITASALAAGPHALMAKQGATPVSAELVITIDNAAAAPGAPDLAPRSDSGPSASDNLTNRSTPDFTGSLAEPGALVTLYDTDGTTVLGTATADAAGTWAITASTLAAGAHTVTARQTDAAGNVSVASAGLAITIDTAAATLGAPDLAAASDSGVSSTDNITNKIVQTFTGSGAEANAVVTLYDTDGTTVLGSAVANASGAWVITTATLGAGSHTMTARQTDRAGNVSAASAGLTVTIDTTAGSAPSTPDMMVASDTGASNTDNITKAISLLLTGTGAEPGALLTLYDSNGSTTVGQVYADGSGNWTLASAALTTGAHLLTAKQFDTAGNVSAPSVGLLVVIDPTVPAAPGTPDLGAAFDSGVSNTDNITNQVMPTIVGSGAEGGLTVTLYDTNGVTVLGTTTASGSGAWSITTSALAAGDHTLTAKQTDKAGNVSSASTALTITIDTTVPAAPGALDLTTASDTGVSSSDNLTSRTTPTISGSGAVAGAIVTLYDTNGTSGLGQAMVDETGAWSITTAALGNGVHRLTAKQTDAAGNISAASSPLFVTIDTVANGPGAPDLIAASDTGVSSSDNITAKTEPSFVGSNADPGATITLYDTDGTTARGTATVLADGTWSLAGVALTDGAHTLTVKQTDLAGNTSVASAGLVVTIDETAGAAPGTPDMAAVSDSGSSNTDNVTSVTTPTITGSGAEVGATVTLYDTNGTTVLGTATATASGTWSVVSSVLANGTHSLTAKQTDKAGNVSDASTALSVTIDTVAGGILSTPDMSASSDSGMSTTDNLTNDTTPTVTGSGAEAGAVVTLFDASVFHTTVLGSAVADSNGKWSITGSALADGVHILTASQADLAGNVSVASAGLQVTVDTTVEAPEILNVTTSSISGIVAEGQPVALYDQGTLIATIASPDAFDWSAQIALSAGTHSLTSTTSDVAGNVSTASPALSVIMGTSGADTLAGTGSKDVMVGGAGNDTYTVNHPDDVAQENSGDGTDTVYASVGYTLTLGSEIEFLYGVDPGATGLALTGNAYANTIVGASGNDTLAGGDDADVLTGGLGADVFVLGSVYDSTPTAADRITDFTLGTDLIDLHLIDANVNVDDDQAFSFIGTAAFSGVAGQLRYATSGPDTQISGDIDGDSTADFLITLTGSKTLTAANFSL